MAVNIEIKNALSTNYQNDVFSGSRKYSISDNSDGTKSINDVTEYTQTGTLFSAGDCIDFANAINKLNTIVTVDLPMNGWTPSAPYTQTIDGIVSNGQAVITADSNPDFYIIPTGTTVTTNELKSFSYIGSLKTGNGSVTFTCPSKPVLCDLKIMMKGV